MTESQSAITIDQPNYIPSNAKYWSSIDKRNPLEEDNNNTPIQMSITHH